MKSLAVILAGAALAVGANAATVSYSFTNPLATTEINQTGSLGLFNSALGTLTGVSIKLDGTNVTELTLTNNGALSQRLRFQSTSNLFFSSTLLGLDGLIQANNPILSLSSVDTGFINLAALGGSRSFGPLTTSLDVTYAAELSSFMNEFVGAGSFGVSCTSLNSETLTGGGGNIDKTQVTKANCGAEITYTYDVAPPNQVPEPASLALVGLALAGLSLSRKARKA